MSKQPNLLFVMADQLGLNHCGYAGSENAITPNLDRFSGESVDLCNAVASSPVCAAYRASLLTGKYTTSTGMVINELRLNPEHHTSLGQVVSAAGYETCYIGKWHLYANELGHHCDAKNSFVPPGPHRLGFDGYWAAYNFHHNYYGLYYHRDTDEKIYYGDDVYEPDAQTEMMIDWLQGRGDTEEPFCAFLSYGTPHDPWTDDNVPEQYRQMFADVEFPNPPNYLQDNDPYADAWGSFKDGEREKLSHWRRNYYAMVANLDWNFGRLLAFLDAQGLAEDTIVVFSSDHGEMFGAHGRRAKNIFYDEAARIPLLIRWPNGLGAQSCDPPVSTVDIMPSLLGLMKLPIPAGVEGMDCSAVISGQSGPEPEVALLQNTGACAAWKDGHEWRALRDRQYTYATYRRDGAELLFDNLADPYQQRNLIDDPECTEIVAKFRSMLAEKMQAIHDTYECCTWYRDNWTEDRLIQRTATAGQAESGAILDPGPQ